MTQEAIHYIAKSRECTVCDGLVFKLNGLDGPHMKCDDCSRVWWMLRSGSTVPGGDFPDLPDMLADPDYGTFPEAA